MKTSCSSPSTPSAPIACATTNLAALHPPPSRNTSNPAYILWQLCGVPDAAQLDVAALAELLRAAVDIFARRHIDRTIVNSSIDCLCSLPGAAQLSTSTVHGLLKQAVSQQLFGAGSLCMLPAATQLNVDQWTIAELAHSLHKANTTMGHECLMADVPVDAIGQLYDVDVVTNLSISKMQQPFAVWLTSLPALEAAAVRQSIPLCNGLLKAVVSALGPSLGGPAVGGASGSPTGSARRLPSAVGGPADCALPAVPDCEQHARHILCVVEQLCSWPGARQQPLQEVQDLLYMAIRACQVVLDCMQLPPIIGSDCLGSLLDLPAAANLTAAAVVDLLEAACVSGAGCCVEQLSRLLVAANMSEQQIAAFIGRAVQLDDADMVALLCAMLPCRVLTAQSIANLVTKILVQFSPDNGQAENPHPAPATGMGRTCPYGCKPSVHSIPSAAAALSEQLSLPAAGHITAAELAGMLHAAAAGQWGYRVLLQLFDVVPLSQPSPAMLVTLSQLTEQQIAEVLSAAAAAGDSYGMFKLIQKLPAAPDLGAGSLLGILQAAVAAGSAESVRYLAALPSAAGIGAAAVANCLRKACSGQRWA